VGDFKENQPGFKNNCGKIRGTRKLESIDFVERKRRVKTRQRSESEKTPLYAQNPGLKISFKNSISDHSLYE
jgi:hypothetical protein